MAAEEQMREFGEKLQAAAPAPADELAKLLEVRRRIYLHSKLAFPFVVGRPARGRGEGWLWLDLCPRRGNSAGLGFSVPPGEVLLEWGFQARNTARGCLATLLLLTLNCEEGSTTHAFARVVGNYDSIG
jgi:hypothetical protein